MTDPSQAAASPETMEKLQSNMALGVSSNFFTIGGIIAAWILLMKTGWQVGSGLGGSSQDNFWDTILAAMVLAPALMGDALDSYFLSRVRVDTRKGWNDVYITDQGRAHIDQFFLVWRGLSLAPALLLSGIFLTGFGPDPSYWQPLKYAFGVFFLANALRCLHTQRTFIHPALPPRKVPSLMLRLLIILGIGAVWYSWLLFRGPVPFGKVGIMLHGLLYFFLCGLLHPLPSRFSLLHLGESVSPKVLREIQILPATMDRPWNDTPSLNELARWRETAGFQPRGLIRLPLPEMPLFQGMAETLASPDNRHLLLFFLCEGRSKPHRCLLSANSDCILLSSDYGAAQARFPDKVRYQSLSDTLPALDFLTRHREFAGDALTELPAAPWATLNQLVEVMFDFFRREVLSQSRSKASITPDQSPQSITESPPPT